MSDQERVDRKFRGLSPVIGPGQGIKGKVVGGESLRKRMEDIQERIVKSKKEGQTEKPQQPAEE